MKVFTMQQQQQHIPPRAAAQIGTRLHARVRAPWTPHPPVPLRGTHSAPYQPRRVRTDSRRAATRPDDQPTQHSEAFGSYFVAIGIVMFLAIVPVIVVAAQVALYSGLF